MPIRTKMWGVDMIRLVSYASTPRPALPPANALSGNAHSHTTIKTQTIQRTIGEPYYILYSGLVEKAK